MFTRQSTYLKTNKVSSELFIQGTDYNNAELLYKIDHTEDRETYRVTKYERRIDLIAEDIYGDKSYYWLLLYMNKINNNNIVRNTELSYIPLNRLTAIINNL